MDRRDGPATAKRLRNVTLERAIVYGSIAYPMAQKNDNDHTHRWTVFVRGINDEDISYYVKRIQFKLHESFAQATRTLERRPYEVTETGWGEFEIQIKIFFQDPAEKPVTFFHHLRLYSTEETSMGPQNSVISERYEEIADCRGRPHAQVFHEPTEFMHDLLVRNRQLSAPVKGSEAYRRFGALEKADLARMEEASKRVQEEMRTTRSRYEKTEAEYQRILREVADLEQQRGIRRGDGAFPA